MDFIRDNLDKFMEMLYKLIEGINDVLVLNKSDSEQAASSNSGSILSLLQKLELALRSQRAQDIEHILEEISHQSLNAKTKEAIEKISDDVLMTEFDHAVEIIKKLVAENEF
jgi:phosphoenolpyruvate-protein kinase (PTS system EI component)